MSLKDPFLVYRFRIQIEGIEAGGFSECAGLCSEIESITYQEGGLNDRIHRFPGVTRQSNLILRRGIVDHGLYDWYRSTADGQISLRNCRVTVFDELGTEAVMAWECIKAFPCGWVGPELNALKSGIAVETLELCHEGLFRIL